MLRVWKCEYQETGELVMPKRRVMLVLGSGATVGAGFKVGPMGRYNPPTDRDFFVNRFVETLVTEENYPALWGYRSRRSLEETWSAIDLYAKLAYGGVLSEEEPLGQTKKHMDQRAKKDRSYKSKMERESCLWRLPAMAGWELRELVQRVLGKMRPPAELKSPLKTLAEDLRKRVSLQGITTFNYDTSVERLMKNELRPVWPGRIEKSDNGKTPLYKLHGSLSWEENEKGVRPNGFDQLGAVQMAFRPDGSWVQPAIVGPTLFKQEITIDFQINASALFFKRLWRMCWEALREVNALVFIGFSFPSTDFHAHALFESLVRIKTFEKVAVCTKCDKDAFDRARQIFGESVEHFDGSLEDLATRCQDLAGFVNG